MMTLKEFLEENPIINKSQLGKSMYPNISSGANKLAHKLAETVSKTGKQRILDSDDKLAKKELEELVHRIVAFINQ